MNALHDIAREVRCCQRCPLHAHRTQAVPGEGPADAVLVLIGEAPGREEDLQGRPFVGKAGRFLDGALREVGIDRSAVFITSVVKCRPPENRTPHKAEIETCTGVHLQRQLAAIEPDVVCLLGATAVRAMLGNVRFREARGTMIAVGERRYLPTYHPAAAARNPAWARAFQRDLSKLAKKASSRL